MATALAGPVTFFMAPIPASRPIVGCNRDGDLFRRHPGLPDAQCLARPHPPAYTDEAYAMTKKGQAELALGAGLVFSALGGLFGTAVPMLWAPALAEFALKFSSFDISGWCCGTHLRGFHHLRPPAQGFRHFDCWPARRLRRLW